MPAERQVALILRRCCACWQQRGANEVWVEAGATLAGAFVREQLFDELVVYLAPRLLGAGASPCWNCRRWQVWMSALRLRFTDCRAGRR